ncbi:MAG: hypothetical protein IJI97_08845 [Clostridia bacterium]|nr:hypothetical protein [Clostridia bacterium]
MQINIETGVESIDVTRNGEIVGQIKFSTSDPALLRRLREVQTKADDLMKDSKLDSSDDLDAQLDEADRLDKEMRSLLDWAFGAPVSDMVFGDSYCFTTSGGVTGMEQFLAGVTPYIEAAFKREVAAAETHRKKYLDKYKK